MVIRNNRPGRCVAIVQARMGSSRLQGKSLSNIEGKPLLEHVVARTQASAAVDDVVVATTIEPEDRAIFEMASRLGASGYAGSVDDVLDRYYRAALHAGAAHVIRITADDPFKDPEVIDLVAAHYFDNPHLDYVSNTIEPTFPDGLDIEIFSFHSLRRAWDEARLPSEREHVTPYIWKHPEWFAIANVAHVTNLSHLRWTLDYPADLEFARAVYKQLFRGHPFSMKEILTLLQERPDIASINQGFTRNEGYATSLAEDHLRGVT